MKRIIIAIAALGLIASSNAQLWDGSPLPPAWGGSYVIDPYFVPGGGGLSEFDIDSGYEFSLASGETKPIGITEALGWQSSANFALNLQENDIVKISFLGKTAGWVNDFGMNLGNTNVSGGTAYTLWSSITDIFPTFGAQTGFVQGANDPTLIDFWLNSNAPLNGGTYSMFFPGTSNPDNTGEPLYGYSARGRVFNVFEDAYDNGPENPLGRNRSVLVIAIEDWRDYDRDFTDMFFAIEIGTRFGEPQFPVPEPSTYGLIGAMVLLGLVAVRRSRR